MTTPIRDFVIRYAERNPTRLHMPGHKGASLLGLEPYDITEVSGADSLYEAGGIIRESEANASALFGCPTFYSTEGSSQCIRAMLYLASLYGKMQRSERRMRVLAGRNAHKTFISAAALLDFDITWLYPAEGDSYLTCRITANAVAQALEEDETVTAVYLTSPDYLGNTVDIASIAEVCHRHGVLLLVDNAHGAYLKFLPVSRHPIDAGADLCCDSAHKTLPVLTGGAYLHIAPAVPSVLADMAKQALALFGSTSPSYLILQSLDLANRYIADGYRRRLAAFCVQTEAMRARLTAHGYTCVGQEPMKLTVLTKPYGYRGTELASLLEGADLVCEFADPDHIVFMFTPEVGSDGLSRLEKAMIALPRRAVITEAPPTPVRGKAMDDQAVLTVREAVMSPSEIIPVSESVGRVLAAATVSCPPAIPIVVCGERITEEAAACFDYYGIQFCTVVRESR